MAKSKKQPKDKAPQSSNETLLKRVLEDLEAWTTYVRPYRAQWDKNWKLYNNKRVKRGYFSNRARKLESFDPMTNQIVETTVDNVYGSRPRLAFSRRRPEQDCNTKTLQAMWEESWDYSDMDLEIMPLGRENEIIGNIGIFLGWEEGKMTMTHVPFPDIILDPAVTRPKHLKKAGYRRLAMLEDLKAEMRFDPTQGPDDGNGHPTGLWVQKYNIPDDVPTWSAEGEQATDKAVKDCYEGSTLSDTGKNKQVEVIYMAYLDKIVEVLNRKFVIFSQDNYLHKDAYEVEVQVHDDQGKPMYDEASIPGALAKVLPGPLGDIAGQLALHLKPAKKMLTVPEIKPFLPFSMGRGQVDGSLLLAKGIVEPVADVQEDINDEVNIKKDNLIFRQQNVGLVDANQPELIPQLQQAKPGSLISARDVAVGEGPVKWVDKPELASDSDIEIARLKQVFRDTVRVDQVTQGVSTQNDRTATEVNAQVAGAASGFGTKTRNLESGLYKDLGEKFILFTQICATEEQVMRIEGANSSESYDKYDPKKNWGTLGVQVTLESRAQAKQLQDKEEARKFYDAAKGDPYINQLELRKKVLPKAFGIDPDEVDQLIQEPAALGPEVPPAATAPGAPPLPPEVPPRG